MTVKEAREYIIRHCNPDYPKGKTEWETALNMAIDALSEQPTVEERKKGKWEMLQIPINPPIYKCSICGKHALETMTGCFVNRHFEACLTDYCPHCGADMRGES